MNMFINKEFKFDAAHNLVDYNGKCENLHGHTYRLRVTLQGNINKGDMIIDFVDLKSIVKDLVIDRLDHAYLNDIVPQSTAENIALWIWDTLDSALKSPFFHLYEINVWETETSFITLRKEG